jgi:hypothetical protein
MPVQWLGRIARFDLAKVRRAKEHNGRSRMRRLNGNSTPQGATGGASRRRAAKKRPRTVKRGRVRGQVSKRQLSACRTGREGYGIIFKGRPGQALAHITSCSGDKPGNPLQNRV